MNQKSLFYMGASTHAEWMPESELEKVSNFTCSIMISDSEGRMKINCSCLELRIGDFAESSQESEGFSD